MPVAGWYPDTDDPSLMRWHDGARWTEATLPSAGFTIHSDSRDKAVAIRSAPDSSASAPEVSRARDVVPPTVPEGWYPDPQNPAQERWYDGSSWTGALRPASTVQIAAAAYGQEVVQPRPGAIHCVGCGRELVWSASFCPVCGTARLQHATRGKSKTAAVLLAVFLGLWSFLYTATRDAGKFVVALAIWLVVYLPATFSVYAYPAADAAVLGTIQLLAGFSVWLWPVILTSVRSSEWYRSYPNG